LFEYISQGVVPILYNHPTASKFVEELNIGIGLKSLLDLDTQLKDGPSIRKNLLSIRETLTMEANIQPLCDLYERIL